MLVRSARSNAMRGIRIQPEVQEVSPRSFSPVWLPADISSFAFFFAPILPRLAQVHWLYESFPFSLPSDAIDYAAVIDGLPNNEGYIAPNTLLPRFASYVNDDWSSLFGFDSLPDAPSVFSHLQPRDYEFMGKHIDLCFSSIDGSHWNFYAQDESLVQAVR